jgi:hypothetical protein
LNFNIMPIDHIDMIIGVNSILFSYFDLFLDMIKVARKRMFNNTSDPTSSKYINVNNITNNPNPNDIPNHPDYINCKPPWSVPYNNISEEDENIPEPCSYTLPLELINVERQLLLNNYYDVLITNTNPELIKAVPAFMEFMKGDIALAVFCPEGWKGISGITPITLKYSSLLPAHIRAPYIPIKPILLERFNNEFDRLRKYMYVPSRSHICSPIVIAPKGTDGIRVCGNYKVVNVYCIHEQAYIPIVVNELSKAQKSKVYGDYDMRTAFHQIPISEETSNILTIMTHHGTFRPLFLPEGCTPASGILNNIVTEIFHDYLDHTIVIFDNFLNLATDYEDFYNKHVAFITRCYERNVILGAKKSFFGYSHANFFGYRVQDGKYSMTEERKKAVSSLVFPTTQKKMESFLGAALFFMKHIPFYSELTAPLHSMTTKGFNWDPTTWTQDYRAFFDKLTLAISHAISITIPDFTLTWILRTDASDVAWGGILLQVLPSGMYECINLSSGKFTDSASKWDIQKKEACAIKLAIEAAEYLLRGKYFIIETDNKNMTYIELSTSSMMIRIRVYIQGFNCALRHLLAKFNKMSDWLTRQHEKATTTKLENEPQLCNINSLDYNSPYGSSILVNAILTLLTTDSLIDTVDITTLPTNATIHTNTLLHDIQTTPTLTLEEMFNSVHGGRNMHRGVQATYKLFNEKYPGHVVPLRVIDDLIIKCSTCQKARLRYGYTYPAENLNLKTDNIRSRVGVDTLTITPVDVYGNYLAIVVVNHFSKLVSIYPCSDHSAASTARALFQHAVRHGRFKQVISDPGSDFMSETMVELNRLFGQERLISLVDVHTSNGVEPTNKKIIGFLRTLMQDVRLKHRWSDPINLGLVEHACNSQVHSETGYSPFELTYGSDALEWTTLPDCDNLSVIAPKILKDLNENLRIIREISYKYQQDLVIKRDNSTSLPSTLNKYKPGDFVFFLYSVLGFYEFKLDTKYLGPYEVITHIKNDVTVRNLISSAISVFHVERLKLFFGSAEAAYDAALRDSDQYVIDSFITYKGDPLVRTSIHFYILFADGCYHWKEWNKELFHTIQYETFCNSLPQLFPLITLLKESLILIKQMNNTPITVIAPNDIVYMDIRAFGAGWYDSLNLPNSHFNIYVVKIVYTKWHNSNHTRISVSIPLLKLVWDGRNSVNHLFVKSWGAQPNLLDNMTLITTDFISEFKIRETLI